MKLASVLGILILAATIIYVEWNYSKEKRAKWLSAGFTSVSALIGIVLLFDSNLPGPSDVVKLLFGRVDQMMK
ncbi:MULTISPECIES: hypothetical protein [unclassified Paenibacillus]|uniref:hypothetical protein n=1 Tax=unclassified Paenibacillus TaxID=185978 RepID=UPI0008BEB3EE|nr:MULTISPECIES: hypothetical protein [unclassified Paenibacillus]QLG38734.1 hypothetical protein HW560_11865 [Paenibacillus sp. E222]SEP08681.1 hypothetical protein SAMN05518670_5576 [Paenibacillus sp. OK076]